MKGSKHSDIIARAQQRSKQFGIYGNADSPKWVLPEKQLQERQHANNELLTTAGGFLHDIHEAVSEIGFIIFLADNEGYILKISGNSEARKAAGRYGIQEGTCMNEQSAGTNAAGTALKEDAALQVNGKEHFLESWHHWSSTAAPVHNARGAIIGVLNITGIREKVHALTFALVSETVKAIEHKLYSNRVQQQLYQAQNYAFAMMNNLSYGVFAIDFHDCIQWVNDTACRIVNIRRTELVNRRFDEILPVWSTIKGKVLHGGEYNDHPHRFALDNIPEKFLFNAYSIRTKRGEPLGFLVSFRSYRKVMKLVSKFGGAGASYTFEDIHGNSAQLQQAVKQAKAVSGSPSTVLLTGERGTGKAIFAQAIHNHSNRSNNGFVTVNCRNVSPTLIESELFGYEEHAFTGAQQGGKTGKFEYADGGTLLLQEIGDLPVEVQAKLLKAIQTGAIVRIGEQEESRVDVRIIATTAKDLKKETEAGRFRQDLFYRINVVEINIPPLRRRREDILLLARIFLRRKAEQLQKPVPQFKQGVQPELTQYGWPGNVSELEHFIEKLVLLNGEISLADYQNQYNKPGVSEQSEFLPPWQVVSLEEAEQKAIKNALVRHKGNISKAARTLKIGRNTLYNKMKTHKIDHKAYWDKNS